MISRRCTFRSRDRSAVGHRSRCPAFPRASRAPMGRRGTGHVGDSGFRGRSGGAAGGTWRAVRADGGAGASAAAGTDPHRRWPRLLADAVRPRPRPFGTDHPRRRGHRGSGRGRGAAHRQHPGRHRNPPRRAVADHRAERPGRRRRLAVRHHEELLPGGLGGRAPTEGGCAAGAATVAGGPSKGRGGGRRAGRRGRSVRTGHDDLRFACLGAGAEGRAWHRFAPCSRQQRRASGVRVRGPRRRHRRGRQAARPRRPVVVRAAVFAWPPRPRGHDGRRAR